jgi:hypothetical protein
MNDIENNYRAAASAYQDQQQNYLLASRRRRLRTISDGDYFMVQNAQLHSKQVLDHAEAAWVASWN